MFSPPLRDGASQVETYPLQQQSYPADIVRFDGQCGNLQQHENTPQVADELLDGLGFFQPAANLEKAGLDVRSLFVREAQATDALRGMRQMVDQPFEALAILDTTRARHPLPSA